ncbi:MAG TPA: signal peptidase II [Acidimicrobiia bacterium]|nr:signal peptidase II [Acidimicrobiia bacterium]
MASGAADATAAPPRTRYLLIGVALLVIVALDQLTKTWVVRALADGPVVVVDEWLEFHLAKNSGSAFGRFQNFTPVLATLAIVVAVLLFRMARKETDRVMLIGLVLILGGALGNLSDRIFRAPGFMRGHVIDFVAVGPWPLFNVADSCVTIGAIVLIVRTLWPPKPAEPADPAEPVQPASP